MKFKYISALDWCIIFIFTQFVGVVGALSVRCRCGFFCFKLL